MPMLTRFALVFGLGLLLQACTASSGIFDNNCSGNGWVSPGSDYCSDYTSGVSP